MVHRLRSALRSEVAEGVVITLAGVAALVWANSPVQASYDRIWLHPVRVGGFAGLTTVQAWVNSGIMALFFLVVGLEIARERRSGSLRDHRTAVPPVVAAFGGMAGAAIVYVIVNHAPPAASGWGIPMATDIAFALGALALLGRRVPGGLRVFLLTLAVADDVGSIVVLVAFYSGQVEVPALLGAVAVVFLLVLCRRRWPTVAWPLLAGGVVLWALMAEAGVEPALAGAIVGVLVPAGSGPRDAAGSGRDLAGRLEHALSPISAFVVLPLFALANAGVTFEATMLDHPGATGVFAGIVLARLVGKMAGITLATLAVVRLGAGRLPDGLSWGHLAGGAAVAGIGFTVPLLFAEEAFANQPALFAASQVGLLVGSVSAFVVGAAILVLVHRRRDAGGPYAVGVGPPSRGRVFDQ